MADDKAMKALEDRIAQLETVVTSSAAFRWPGPVVDPAPWGGGGGGGWSSPWWPRPFPIPPVVDPAPFPFAAGGGAQIPRGWGPNADPPPIDLSRLSAVQLESALHTIHAEKARLEAMEGLIKKQLQKTK